MEVYLIEWKWKDDEEVYSYFHVVSSQFAFHKILFERKRSEHTTVLKWERLPLAAICIESPTKFYLGLLWDGFINQFRMFGRFYYLTPKGRFYKKMDKRIARDLHDVGMHTEAKKFE